MGGIYSHMSHLFEHGDLTFSDIEEIFRKAASGKLEGTRKTDGINLFLSYSIKRNTSVAARNHERDLKNGGSTAEEIFLAYEKKEQQSLEKDEQTHGPMKDVFVSAIKMFDLLIQNMDLPEQKYFFGENADIWYNVEILNQKARNVIKYDADLIIIHRVGGGILNRETGKITNLENMDKLVGELQAKVTRVQTKYPYKFFPVQVDAIEHLQELSNNELVNSYLNQLKNIYISSGLTSQSTLIDYIFTRMKPLLNEKEKEFGTNISNETKIFLIKRLFGVSISLTSIKKDLNAEQKAFVDFFQTKDVKRDVFKRALAPLEILISDFSSELLKTMQSLFVVDPSKENERIKKQLQIAIDYINNSNISEKSAELKRQLDKLKKVDDVLLSEEGFVFDWKGQIFKFTGKFAPINQILGLEKTMRFELEKVKSLSMANSELGKEKTVKQTSGKKVGIILGSFKPPHKGHLKLIKETLQLVDHLYILVSDPKTKENVRTIGIIPFPSSVSEEMLKAYVRDFEDVEKITIKIEASPMEIAMDYVGGKDISFLPKLEEVSKIIVGFSEEDQLKYYPLIKYTKFDKQANIDDYEKFGINKRTYFNIVKPEIDLDGDRDGTKKLSATRFRLELLNAIKTNNAVKLEQFFPNTISTREKIRFINLIKMEYERQSNMPKEIKDLKENKLDDIINQEIISNYAPIMIYRG